MLSPLILLVALAAAEPLQPVRVVRAGGRTLNSRYAANANGKSAGLWDLRAGRQVALFEPSGLGHQNHVRVLDVRLNACVCRS